MIDRWPEPNRCKSKLRQLTRIDFGAALCGGRTHHCGRYVAAGVAPAPLGGDTVAEDFADMISDAVGHFNRTALLDLAQLGQQHHRVDVRNRH